MVRYGFVVPNIELVSVDEVYSQRYVHTFHVKEISNEFKGLIDT